MSFSVKYKEVNPEEISPGVFMRVLLKPENTGKGPPGDLTVTHYTLRDGGKLVLDDPNVEYQDYIICGMAYFGNKYLFSNTTIFVPSGKSHTYQHTGECETHILSHKYEVPHPSHRWCKTRVTQLTFPNTQQQLMTEEYHALVGAHRFHALDVQDYDVPEHQNPEETAYFIAGWGEVGTLEKINKFKPGTLVYIEEETTHWIKRNQESPPLHYFVMEYTEQDKMWSSRGIPRIQ